MRKIIQQEIICDICMQKFDIDSVFTFKGYDCCGWCLSCLYDWWAKNGGVCLNCKGRGQITQREEYGDEVYPCNRCNGTGKQFVRVDNGAT